MNFADLVGQTLDGKYKIERQLGRGGMGTVYLATHLGTERPVAVKVIAPQFMERAEFVERFRREARAAGRLRHPNVVNVTDFGFAETSDGRAAYLAMEYLDGCTLGEILEEEHNLPVAWTLDILEQVCSAVHEAHEQGIIHRDLKPDNIWLEPNQRGGYTVKVLDFGIAKLEEHRTGDSSEEIEISVMPNPTQFFSSKTTVADHQHGDTVIHDSVSPTRVFESATMAQTADASEARTAILPLAAPTDEDPDATGTRLMSDEHDHPDAARPTQVSTSDDLTRVGAVIGTPLYMSPEQCRGERLDARSDIYSLGVIAYQMLAGRTPFEGDFTYVMEAHKLIPPPPLDAKKVRKKLKGVIVSALEKNPDDRPQTAEAFASVLRSRSEGIFGLLRRAGMIYTSYMPKFLILSAFFFIPMIILTASLMTLTVIKAAELLSEPVVYALLSINGISLWVIGTFCAYMIVGTITWIVAQNLAVPLRPIRLRPALREAKRKWKTFAGTSILAAMLPVAACIIAFIPAFAVVFALVGLIAGFGGRAAVAGLVAGLLAAIAAFIFVSTRIMLVAAVVMMESKGGWQAIKRAQQLVRRSFATAIAAFLLMFIIPAATAETLSFVVKRTARSIQSDASNIQIVDKNSQPSTDESAAQPQPDAAPAPSDKDHDVTINFGGRAIRVNGDKKEEDGDMSTRVTNALLETLSQLLILPLQIIFTSFTAIISALLYLKTRQSGGEPLKDLLEKFEETEHPRKKWQERVRQRLIQSGRITSRP